MNSALLRPATRRILCALVVLGAAALAFPRASHAQCVGLTIAGAPGPRIFSDGFEVGDAVAWSLPAAASISIAATTDLLITLHLDGGLVGEHVVELRFETPGGFLYQSLAVPISPTAAGAETSARTRLIPGYPFPVAVRSPGHGARLVAGELAIEFSLPVAGTPIAQTSITGGWLVRAFFDAAEAACLAPKPFFLEP